MPDAAVLVPIKGFQVGKSRLSTVLDDASRALLARTMAEQVLNAAGGLPVHVATDDERVAAWALARAAKVVWTEGLGLNDSVASGLATMRDAGHSMLVVAHADLPFADSLAPLTWFAGASIVPDRHDDGTNVLSIPASVEFEPMYGTGSYARHLEQLRGTGLAVRTTRIAALQWDVDVPDDLPGSSLPLTVSA